MAAFPRALLTNAGKNMIALAQLGQKLIFTKAKYGDGTLIEGDDQEAFTQLKQARLDLPIQSMTNPGTGQIEVEVLVDRTNLEAGFFGREVGLFAKIGDTGSEQLFCYTNAGNKADYIPDKAENDTPYHEFIDIATVVGNSQNLTVIMDDAKVYITRAEFLQHIQLNRLWQPNKAVQVGDICYSSNALTDSFKMMECTQAGTTGQVEPLWGMIESITADASVQWQICDIRDTSVSGLAGRRVVLDQNNTIPISLGGTGGTTALQARTNLGVAPLPNTTVTLQVPAAVQPVAPSGGTWIWNCFVAIVTTTGLPSSSVVDYGKGVVAGGSNVGFPNGGLFRIFVFEQVN